MGRVNRLMERRALRRAADQALLTSMAQRLDGAAPGGAPDQDFEYTGSNPYDTDASHDHEPVTEPIPLTEVQNHSPTESVEVGPAPVDLYDLVPHQPEEPQWDDVGEVATEDDSFPSEIFSAPDQLPDDFGWDDHDEVPPPPVATRPLRARPLAEAATLVHPAVDTPMPQYRPQPWYRIKPVATVLIAAVVVAVLCGGWLALRSPTTTAEQSSIEAPTSAASPPNKALPTAVSAPQPPPAPPPPPLPPTADPLYSAPQQQYSEPRYSAPPSQDEKPKVDVTRAPISVEPVPRPFAGSDSNTPGDAAKSGGHRGCFGWC